MGILNLLLSKKRRSIIVLMLVFSFGMGVVYYGKYRPLRNRAISLESENKQLREHLSILYKDYVEMANTPRYKIDQHLDRIKIKKGSKLNFAPDALMQVVDSMKSNNVDSVVLPQKKKGFLKKIWDKWFN